MTIEWTISNNNLTGDHKIIVDPPNSGKVTRFSVWGERYLVVRELKDG